MGTCNSAQSSPSLRRINNSIDKRKGARRASRTSLHEAVQTSDVLRLAKLLFKGHKPNVYDRRGLTPLHLACEIGDSNLVTLLISRGAAVNYATSDTHGFSTPLIFAASNGNTECVHLLIGAGACVNDRDEWGNTALFKAACYNHSGCVELLLNHGADPNVSNRWGALPLQYAALQGYTEIIKLLLNRNCDISLRGEESVSPSLTAAAMRGFHACVQLLLKAGCDPDWQINNNGETALYHAIKHCQHATNGYNANSSATISDRFACIQSLLQHGATVTRPCLELLCIDGFFSTLLNKDNMLLYKIILRGFPLDPSCRPFLECLFEDMVRIHRWEIVQLLISIGFTPNQENMDEVGDSLLDDHWQFLEKVRKVPRTLQDACRNTIRQVLPKNVLYSAPKLGLPRLVEDFIVIKNPSYYSYDYQAFTGEDILMRLLDGAN